MGEQLVIAQLSKELGVSNSPIREAFSSLESDGLIKMEENSQYHVITLNESELLQINEAALYMLISGYEICRNKGNIEKLVNLLKISFEKQKMLYELNSKFDYEYISNSLNFDRQILIAAENEFLLKMFNELLNSLVLSSIYNKQEYKNIHLEEHQNLINSIEADNYEKTIENLKIHFNKDISSMEY